MKLDEISLGDIKFCTSSRAITLKDGHPVQLRNKSKEVLLFLVQNADRVVTKKELLDAVWSDVYVSDESLVQCIADIRRIVGDDAKQIVETIPRKGYRILIPVDESSKALWIWKAAFVVAVSAVGVLLLTLFYTGSESSNPIRPALKSQAQSTPPGTDNIQAYLEVLQGRLSADRFSSKESLLAERHFRSAIELDSNYARAYAELAVLLAVRFENDWTVLEAEDKEKALFYAERSIAIDPDLWLAHYALGRLHSLFANFEAAENHLKRAMSLQPDNEDARAYYGVVLIFKGDPEGAVAILEPTITSHPNPPFWYYLAFGHALFHSERYEKAESAFKKCLELATKSPYCLRYQIALYGEMGRTSDAKKTANQYEKLGFEPSVEAIMKVIKDRRADDRHRLERALGLAGLPND